MLRCEDGNRALVSVHRGDQRVMNDISHLFGGPAGVIFSSLSLTYLSAVSHRFAMFSHSSCRLLIARSLYLNRRPSTFLFLSPRLSCQLVLKGLFSLFLSLSLFSLLIHPTPACCRTAATIFQNSTNESQRIARLGKHTTRFGL